VAVLNDEARHCSCEKPAAERGVAPVFGFLATTFFLAGSGSRAGTLLP